MLRMRSALLVALATLGYIGGCANPCGRPFLCNNNGCRTPACTSCGINGEIISDGPVLGDAATITIPPGADYGATVIPAPPAQQYGVPPFAPTVPAPQHGVPPLAPAPQNGVVPFAPAPRLVPQPQAQPTPYVPQ